MTKNPLCLLSLFLYVSRLSLSTLSRVSPFPYIAIPITCHRSSLFSSAPLLVLAEFFRFLHLSPTPYSLHSPVVLRQAARKTRKKRTQRATSNVFAMFDEAQIQEFKEAFNLIDQNHDGYIDEADLREMFSSLGKLA